MPVRYMFAVNQSIVVYPRCGGVGMGDPERGWRGMLGGAGGKESLVSGEWW